MFRIRTCQNLNPQLNTRYGPQPGTQRTHTGAHISRADISSISSASHAPKPTLIAGAQDPASFLNGF